MPNPPQNIGGQEWTKVPKINDKDDKGYKKVMNDEYRPGEIEKSFTG